jgi:hypothetical protein
MKDFEVHELGTHRELFLSRQLAREIEQVVLQYGAVVPKQVLDKYELLKAHYDYQRQCEML